ncbi:PAS domain S-box protein [Halorarum halophilum]|uniref:PAS domain S-box protein n=1 Tax=Halorarum halophilum TaxID=2743090 RepID=A0A7D5KEA6_9EURY|nr:PAS domain S-box protein [Halobaculum halophilum]QLG26656.1 PAS domain S-box protein [Halobaculum halophilum]
MCDQPDRVLYADPNEGRAERVRHHLETGGERRVTVVRTVEEIRDVIDDEYACVILTPDVAADDPCSLLSAVADEYPTVNSILLSELDSPVLFERAYDVGVDEVVHYTGEEAARILDHHVGKFATDEESGVSLSPTHLEELMDVTEDAVVTIDARSRILYANPAVESVFGYTPEELVGESLTEIMSDEFARKHSEGIRRYLETGERTLDWANVELPCRHKDGHSVPLSISFSEFTVDGKRYFTGIMRDVTERKRHLAERRLLHETSQRILHAETFEDGLEIALNEVGDAMNWAYGEAWVLGENGERLERAPGEYVTTDESSEFAEGARSTTFERGEGLPGRCWETGEPEWIADLTDDGGFERATTAHEAGLHTALAVPIVADGDVVAVLVFMLPEAREVDEGMIEVTATVAADLGRLMQRLRVETDLREERALKDLILETSPVGILILDDEGTFKYLNGHAREMLGLAADEPAPSYDALDIELLDAKGDRLGEDGRPYRTVIEDRSPVAGEFRLRIDGEDRWLSASGVPMVEGSDEVTAAVFSIQDLTERKRREQQLVQYETVMQTVSDGIYAVDEDGRFVAVNDAYTALVGHSRDELLGRRADEVVSDSVIAKARRLQEELLEGDDEVTTLETTITTADGRVVPIEVRISLFPLGDDRFGRVGVVRDITERRRREERLALLNEVAQSLTGAETYEEVTDIVLEAASETLGLPLTSVEFYDEERGHLVPTARTEGVVDLVGTGPLFESTRGIPWRAYAGSEQLVYDDLRAEQDVPDGETPLRSAIVVPIGKYGVFVSGATEPDAIGETEVTVANILAANVHAALDRVDREQELRARKDRLEEQNDTLERVNRINRVIRSITQSLTQATSREDIVEAVCRELTEDGPYAFSWVAERTSVTGNEVTASASAGAGDGYLDGIGVSVDGDDEEGTDPTGRAFRTHEIQVQNDLHTDPPFEPWRSRAIEHGFRSSVAVPLTYGETLYGVLNVYAARAGMFEEMEASVLEELGEMVGYAINAMERKKLLVSDSAVELEFELSDPSIPAIRFARETGGTFEFDEFVQGVDGSFRVFFTVSGADPETVYEFADRIDSVTGVSLISERDGAVRFEANVSESGYLGKLVSYGAHPRSMSATPDGGRVTVELPRSGDLQSFIRMFLDTFEGSELVARRERDRPIRTRKEFQAVYKERLTERQEEVMKTAYFSGFFEWPRHKTGQEIAEMLGVSQPTVNRHIRTGERKLLDVAFEDDDPPGG